MDLILDNLDTFGEGLWVTIQLTFISYFFAFLVGLVIASFRISPIPPLRWAGATYVELVRNTPLLVLMLLGLFGLPKLGITWSPFVTAVIILSLYTGSFIAETIRAGVNTVDRGQVDAARSLGLTGPQALGIVVIPQALRSVVAPLGSLFVALIKNTAVAFGISVIELTGAANEIGHATADYLPAFAGAFAAYLLLAIPSGLLVGVLERRTRVQR